MGAPHNPDRYGETWPEVRIVAALRELEPLRSYVVVSGGWAWHFMSPEGHIEYKHLHDHKDIDLFAHPIDVWKVRLDLEKQGFRVVKTRFDASEGDFRRFEKSAGSFKITIDLFARSVPFRVVRDDLWKVVEPEFLLSLYGSVHSSSECFAVKAARELIAGGDDPVGNVKLAEVPF